MIVPPNQYDDTMQRWREQLKHLEREIVTMFYERDIWSELTQTIVEKNPSDGGLFVQHYARLYVSRQAMALRRLVKANVNNDAHSLGTLIQRIAANPSMFTKERYVATWNPSLQEQPNWETNAEIEWQNRWANTESIFDTAHFDDLYGRLDVAAGKVVDLANNQEAHISLSGTVTKPTFGEIDRAINLVGDACNVCSELFNDNTNAYELFGHEDWKAPFRHSLYEPILVE